MGNRTVRRGWLLLILWLGAQWAAAGTGGAPRRFELDGGDAAVMLNEFSRQSDLQVLFDYDAVNGMKTRAVHAELAPSEALRRMLSGTGLEFEYVNAGTLAVTPPKPAASRARRIWNHFLRPAGLAGVPNALEQVLVTGASDSGTQPLLGAESIQLSRADIDRSGFATAQDLLHTLPQVFGGGPSEDTLLIGREAITNSARGAGVNIRGLDAGETLVLIDGRRVAPSGTEGAFEDISNVPLSAVDHIDLLPDGVAARYGADAVGGVVNIVMRSDFNGAQTQARAGTVTDGSLAEHQVSQVFGTSGDAVKLLVDFEYYQRDALRARDRRQETSNLTPFGGNNFDTPYGSPGTISSGATFWPIPPLAAGTALTVADLTAGRPNLYDQYQGADVTPSEARWSFFSKAGARVSDALSLFADALFTSRSVNNISGAALPLVVSVPSSNPFYVDPAGGTAPVTVLEGTSTYFGIPQSAIHVNTGNFALGMALSAGRGWTVMGSVAYTFEDQHESVYGLYDQTALDAALADPNPATAFDPFAPGAATNPATLQTIGRTGLFELASDLTTLDVTAEGPLATLPAGDAHLSAGAEYRRQTFDTLEIQGTPSPDTNPRSSLGRRISAAFAELRVPVLGTDRAERKAGYLELSFGVRHESYSDIAGATVPKLGLSWSPTPSLGVRATWSKAYRPPNLPDLSQQNSFSTLLTLPDTSAPSGLTTALVRYGTNPELQAERARSWTLGLDFAPAPLPGLSLSLTYFDIREQGRIDAAQITQDVLQRPDLAWAVTRNVTAAQIADVCAHSTFTGAPSSCAGAAAGAIIDERLNNIALLRTRGTDLATRYVLPVLPVLPGRLELGLNGTYLFEYAQANTPVSPLLSRLSTQNNPIDLRLRGSAWWTLRGWGVSASAYFDNSYRDTISVPARKVNSWTTADLQLSYETAAAGSSWLDGIRVSLNVENLFDTHPPFLNNSVGVGYDQENGDLLGRFISLDIRKRW